MCNVFKPERCHHCSTCNRCVLNMDHHCPWISNCVGFWNRKYFMLMLIYIVLIIYYYLGTMCDSLIEGIRYFVKINKENLQTKESAAEAFMIILYLFLAFVGCMLTMFTKFHFTLIFRNITTLESIEKRSINFQSTYDLGKRANWEQVFGNNPKMWFFPITYWGGKPAGNGVNWLQRDENGNQIMSYQDSMFSEETSEKEYKKLQSESNNKADSNAKAINEADYYEKIKKISDKINQNSGTFKKKVMKPFFPQEKKKSDASIDLNNSKHMFFKNDQLSNRSSNAPVLDS